MSAIARHSTSLKITFEVATVVRRCVTALCSRKAARMPFWKGTEWDSAVMLKRSDKMSATAGAALAGRTVTVAAFFRAKNRKITEWLDTPVSAPAQAPQ